MGKLWSAAEDAYGFKARSMQLRSTGAKGKLVIRTADSAIPLAHVGPVDAKGQVTITSFAEDAAAQLGIEIKNFEQVIETAKEEAALRPRNK